MTKAERKPPFAGLIALCAACLFAASGCIDQSSGQVSGQGGPGGSGGGGLVIRNSGTGPVAVTYISSRPKPGAPADGVRAALVQAMGDMDCSAASFHWSERDRAMRWIREQLDERRRRSLPPRLLLAGHGLGATEASETARDVLFGDRDVEIVLLLTVDAVKTNKIGSAAAVTGTAIAKRIPGVDHNFTAYDAAPEPDGRRFRAHINYYQTKSAYYHGTAMPRAENHRIDDWTGLLNHGNADDFALTFLIADLRQALRAAGGRE